MTGYESADDDNIKVYVRVRPIERSPDFDIDQSVCLNVTSHRSLVLQSRPDPKVFTYDHVAEPNTTQGEVFATVGKKIIESCVGGYNGTIFAYGQTGSGKTFTMLGPPDDGQGFENELRGVIPRCFEYLFSLVNRERGMHGERVDFLCRCSLLEIYNEQLFDLLDTSSTNLHLREDIKRGVFVEGLKENIISSSKEAYKVLQSGWLNRRVASTSMNHESSRSHAVFTVSLESKERKGGMANIKVAKLHLVDLAGSERQKDTHTEGTRLKEAGSINRSLSALGNVIMALVDIAHGKTRYIHYRDSKLTFILRDSLGGNAKTCIIANITPSSRCFGETLSTLNFARRAKMIKNKAIVNEDITGNVAELQAEIKRLKEVLASQPVNHSMPNNETAPQHDGKLDSVKVNNDTKEMMLAAFAERQKAENEKEVLQRKINYLEELCNRKEKSLQSTRMILKFRENDIMKLEKSKAGKKTAIERDEDIQQLKEEIRLLNMKVTHHPEVTRFAMENVELRAKIKQLTSASSAVQSESPSRSLKTNRYIINLERQLKELMMPNEDSSESQLQASNSELERIKLENTQLQIKLDSIQQEMTVQCELFQQTKEELIEHTELWRKKEIQFESNLRASKDTCTELKRAIDTQRIKTGLERSAMANIHMQTIKSLTSPMRLGTPHSRSTPQRKPLLGSPYDSPLKDNSNYMLADEPPPNDSIVSMPKRKDSFEGSDTENDDFFHDLSRPSMNTSVNESALADEVKQIQDICNKQREDLNNEVLKRIGDGEVNLKLKHTTKELEQALASLSEKSALKEKDLNANVQRLTDKLNTLQIDHKVLESEAEDLRVLHQSAYKEITALRAERSQEGVQSGRRYASLESKYLKLESDFLNLRNVVEDLTESNQVAQTDAENSHAELAFMSHANDQLKSDIVALRAKVKDAENENNNLLQRIEMEMELNLRLSQEANQEELLEENKSIKQFQIQLKSNLEKKESENKELISELQRLKNELTTLIKRSDTDNDTLLAAVQSSQEGVIKLEKEKHSLLTEFEELKNINDELNQLFNVQEEKTEQDKKSASDINNKLSKELREREQEVSDLRRELAAVGEQNRGLMQCSRQQIAKEDETIAGDVVSISFDPALSLNEAVQQQDQRLEIVNSENEILRQQNDNYKSGLEEMNADLEATKHRCAKLEMDYNMASEDNEEMIDRLQRMQDLEKNYFDENENLKSTIEVITEEKKRLKSELTEFKTTMEELQKENAKLAGHQNLNQRIQHLVALKNENQLLKDQLFTVKSEKESQVKKSINQSLSLDDSCN